MPPKRAVISITNKCNLRCKMCDIGQKQIGLPGLSTTIWDPDSNILTPQEWSDGLNKLGVSIVDIIGVEPLLYKEFDQLTSLLKDKTLSLTTNGWYLTKYATTISKYFKSVTISIDGPSSKVHDEIRGVAGSFDRIIDGIQKLRKNGFNNICISYAITPDNYLYVKESFNLFINQMRSKSVVFNHYNYIAEDNVNLSHYNLNLIDSQILYNQIKDISKYCFPILNSYNQIDEYYHNTKLTNFNAKRYCKVLSEIISSKRYVISADGGFLPGNRCWIDVDLGNIKNGKYNNGGISKLKIINESIMKNGFPPKCQRLCCGGKLINAK